MFTSLKVVRSRVVLRDCCSHLARCWFFPGMGDCAAKRPAPAAELVFAVGETPPSFDGHRETTFGMLHPMAPHYSTLLRFDPQNYPKIVGDVAEKWSFSKDGLTLTVQDSQGHQIPRRHGAHRPRCQGDLRQDHFSAGGSRQRAQGLYAMVDKVEAPDDLTVVFKLKHIAASFLANLASPWNFIYSAEQLKKDPRWYEKNVMGSGPFVFGEHVAGSHWVGKKNPNYFMPGRPYLDGFRAVFIRDTAPRVAAVRSGQAVVEFRGFNPAARDDIVKTLGQQGGRARKSVGVQYFGDPQQREETVQRCARAARVDARHRPQRSVRRRWRRFPS